MVLTNEGLLDFCGLDRSLVLEGLLVGCEENELGRSADLDAKNLANFLGESAVDTCDAELSLKLPV